MIAGLYFLGIRGLTYIGGFWNVFTGEKDTTSGDTDAPFTPTFAPRPSYTKTEKISVSGFAEPASKVTLFINGVENGSTVAEALGPFKFSDVTLTKEGKNTITATATDGNNNVSQKSAELIITLDRKPPKLEVTSPEDGQTFSGEDKQIRVKGKTESGATVKVNELQAAVLADGTFKATLTASAAGEIKITVVATDKAGNEEKVELTVTYSPSP